MATLKRGGISKSRNVQSESEKENLQEINVGSADGQNVTVLEEKYESDDSDCMIVTIYDAPPRTAPMRNVPKSEKPQTPPPVVPEAVEYPAIIPFSPLSSSSKPASPSISSMKSPTKPSSPVVPVKGVYWYF